MGRKHLRGARVSQRTRYWFSRGYGTHQRRLRTDPSLGCATLDRAVPMLNPPATERRPPEGDAVCD